MVPPMHLDNDGHRRGDRYIGPKKFSKEEGKMNLKKTFLVAALSAGSIGTGGALVACNSDPFDVTIGTINWGVVQSNGSLSQDVEMYPYSSYTVRYTFSYEISRDNSGDIKFRVQMEYGNVSVIEGSVNLVNTGQYTELNFTDSSGQGNKRATYDFSAPDKAGETRTATIDINYEAKSFGNTSTVLTISNMEAENVRIRGQGADGVVKGFTVNKIKIDTPVLTYNQVDSSLSWKHVEGASVYTIHVSDKDVTDGSESTFPYSVPENTSVGTQLDLPITNYPSTFLSGHTYYVSLEAGTSDVNYSSSDRSTAVTVSIS